jgi:anti-sigma factor RsiW
MSCSSIDLKAYVLGEVDRQELAACENHVAACPTCREEMAQLKLTQAALLSLPDEEIPQRIAFVSDKVFEPKWWQTIWRSGPLLGFASALLLSSAIFVHAFTRPVPAAVAPAAVAQIDTTRVNQQIEAAVTKAVAAVEKRQDARTAQVLAAAEQRYEFQRRADLVTAQETISLYKNQMARMMYAANYSSARNER